MCSSRFVSTTRPIATLFISLNGFPNDREGVMADLAVWAQIVGADEISGIDLGAVDEFVDLDRPRRFQRHVLKLLFGDLDEGVGVDLVALDDVLVGDFLAGVGVDLGVFDAVAGLPVELIERDLLGFRGGWVQRDGTGDERQAKGKPFQFARGAMYALLQQNLAVRTLRNETADHGSDDFSHTPSIRSIFRVFRLLTDSTFVHVMF